MASDVITIRHGKASMKLIGFGTLYKKLQKLSPNALEEGKAVLNHAVERVYQKSQALVPIAPEDGGQLKASGKKSKARVYRKTGIVSASVSYGGEKLEKLAPADSPIYAIVMHEDLAAKHEHGQAKFLEIPGTEEKEAVLRDLGEAIMKAAQRG